MSSSSILSSEAEPDPVPARRVCSRLGRFLAPLALIGLLAAAIVVPTGELVPVSVVVWLQTFGKPFIFLPQLSDHTYRFKLDAARRFRPEVVVLGSSRTNQWRSAMFRPAGFYNAGNSVFVMRDFRRMLEEFGDYTPRIIIFSIDYFVFLPSFDAVYKNQSRDDLNEWGSAEQCRIIKGVLQEAVHNPSILWRTQHEGIPAIGLSAIKSGVGFRLDGSYNYGPRDLGNLKVADASIRAGTQWPILPAAQLDSDALREFERFTDLARKKGIALVGVTMPFVPQLVSALEGSPRYQAWKEFESAQTKAWIRNQGVIYFDFTSLEDFAGKADEFADPFHPSEPAYIRMLIKMLDDPQFRALFPDMDSASLKERLNQATRLDAYGNEF